MNYDTVPMLRFYYRDVLSNITFVRGAIKGCKSTSKKG